MSMPSSRLDVATRAGSLPAFSWSSMSSRCSRAIDPWWARTSSSPARSLSRAASRSASRREFTKIRVDVCVRMRSRRTGWMAGQIEVRTSGSPAAGPDSTSGMTLPSSPMSSTGTMTSSSSCLRTPASTTATGRARPLAGRRVTLAPAEEPGHLVERPLGGRQPDALRRPIRQPLQPLQRQGQVGAPLGGRHRVDLVDDHVLDRPQDLAGPRREHEVERLGRGDQHVGRVADDVAPVGLRRVAGADAHPHVGRRQPPPARLHGHARQGRPQVALDVVGEGLQGGDVEHPQPALGVGRRAARSPAGRGPTGRRPGSCPTRWGRGSGCGRPG